MKKIVSTLIAGLMAVSLVMMGCSNDSSSDNTALMLLVSSSVSSSGSSDGTVAAGGAVKALADAKAGETVDLSEYKLSDKIALTVDKAITVKNAKLNGGYITVSEKATLDNVDGGTIVLDGNGKNATLKDCDVKNVIVKEAELSRGVSDFTLKIIGGIVENIVNNIQGLAIETTKTTIKKLITKQNLVINSTDDSKIELISASEQITLAGKLVIEKAVSEKTVKVASNTVSIKKGKVEIVADDSEYAEDNLNIETIKAAVDELTDSESKEISNTLEDLKKEAEEMESNIQAAEDEANKALEEYKKAVVTFYLVEEGKVSHEENVPLAEVEKALETLTASIPEGGKIELFSDEACTKPVEVKNIKAGDKIYIKVSGDIHDEPVTPGECVTFYVVYEGQVLPDQRIVPLAEVEKALETWTTGIPGGGKIELFSDEACTKPVDVKTIKAGDKIYIKVSGDIHDEPVIPGEYFIVCFVDEGQVSSEQKVPLSELENFLKSMTVGGKIELFSDEACTTPVDVETIKAGDKIYIKYPEISDLPDVPDLPDEPYAIVNGENVPLSTMFADLENGQSFYINGEVNMGNENGWLPMTGNVFIFEYDEKMNAWGSKTGSVKVNMTRNAKAADPYADGVRVSVWDKSENISFSDKDTAIILNGLVQGKMYALVMTNSTNDYNTDGKGKHVELYEVVMGE